MLLGVEPDSKEAFELQVASIVDDYIKQTDEGEFADLMVKLTNTDGMKVRFSEIFRF